MAQIKHQRKVNYPNIEEAMSMWVERAICNGLTITDHILQVKAKEFADRFRITEFNASAGWITTLKGETLFLHIGAEEKSAVHLYKIFHVTEMNFKPFFRIMNSKIFSIVMN